jgi:hypothetical protein
MIARNRVQFVHQMTGSASANRVATVRQGIGTPMASA